MKNCASLIIIALLMAALAGCSKTSPATTNPSLTKFGMPKLTDLGVVEMSDGLPVQCNLGSGKVCVITPTVIGSGVRLAFVIKQTNSAGVVQTMTVPAAELTGKARTVEIMVGDVYLRVTPKIKQPVADAQNMVLPGRHRSEHQIAEIVDRELPQNSGFQCEFKDGVWEILEVQKGVWGVLSTTANTDGHIFIQSTNTPRLVLWVRDIDGKVERVETL